MFPGESVKAPVVSQCSIYCTFVFVWQSQTPSHPTYAQCTHPHLLHIDNSRVCLHRLRRVRIRVRDLLRIKNLALWFGFRAFTFSALFLSLLFHFARPPFGSSPSFFPSVYFLRCVRLIFHYHLLSCCWSCSLLCIPEFASFFSLIPAHTLSHSLSDFFFGIGEFGSPFLVFSAIHESSCFVRFTWNSFIIEKHTEFSNSKVMLMFFPFSIRDRGDERDGWEPKTKTKMRTLITSLGSTRKNKKAVWAYSTKASEKTGKTKRWNEMKKKTRNDEENFLFCSTTGNHLLLGSVPFCFELRLSFFFRLASGCICELNAYNCRNEDAPFIFVICESECGAGCTLHTALLTFSLAKAFGIYPSFGVLFCARCKLQAKQEKRKAKHGKTGRTKNHSIRLVCGPGSLVSRFFFAFFSRRSTVEAFPILPWMDRAEEYYYYAASTTYNAKLVFRSFWRRARCRTWSC